MQDQHGAGQRLDRQERGEREAQPAVERKEGSASHHELVWHARRRKNNRAVREREDGPAGGKVQNV